MNTEQYEPVIGLEVHVQLSTRSKAFCGDATRFGSAPNTQVSAISLGHPGTLPRLNEQQIAYAVRLGLALGSRINLTSTFDRKNYFYADLPKGYQITQDRQPICVGGRLPVRVGERWKEVRIHHIHMEEDAGKSIHDQDADYSRIDLNRAGVPLLEVVTEPDMYSAGEVDAFMSGMRQLVRYLDISDGNMEQGSMRCDINVSLRPRGAQVLGQRCEIKNVNSMRYARRAIDYEVRRQAEVLAAGGRVEQQTLNFDPATGITAPLRDKEEAHDYRYFPDPDLPPVALDEAYVAAARAALPALPWQLYRDFQETYGLSAYDAALLSEERETAGFYIGLCRHVDDYKAASNLLINKITPHCKAAGLPIDAFPVPFPALAAFLRLIGEGKVSNTIAYQQLFPALVERPEEDPLAIARRLNLLQTSDAGFLESLIGGVLEANPDKVKAYRSGKKGLLGFFMGEAMKASKGKADPKAASKLLRQILEGQE